MSKIIMDYEGNIFDSIASICKHWGIDEKKYRRELKKRLLGIKDQKPVKDYLGNTFINEQEMKKYWGLI